MRNGADRLVDVVLGWLPETAEIDWPLEVRSTCSNCPLVADPRARFSPDTRCCTYHPTLWNWQVGRALRRDDTGAAKVRERIAVGEGVDAAGIAPPAGWRDRYFSPRMAFGQDVAMRCPYWVGGEHACGIWRDRNATCRTWFCKHDDGPAGRRLWGALREALELADRALGERCMADLRGPGSAPPAAWEAYFRGCADHVDTLRDLPPPPALAAAREALLAADERRRLPIPERPIPAVQDQDADDEHLLQFGYSRYDPFPAPPGVVELLARLDGKTPWREALAAAEAEVGPLGEELVSGLWRAGLLAPE